jgi:hypothetical protein
LAREAGLLPSKSASNRGSSIVSVLAWELLSLTPQAREFGPPQPTLKESEMRFVRPTVASMLSLTLTSSLASSASAAPVDSEYDGADWGYSILSGVGGGLAGGLLGGLLGYGLAHDDTTCDENDSLACPFSSVALTGAAAGVFGGLGLTFGSAGGVYAYGELSGHSGNYWAALGGSAAGVLGAFGVYALFSEVSDDAGKAAFITSGLILPAVLGTWTYALSLDEGGEGRIPTGGLIDVDDGVVRLGVPEVGIAMGREGFERVDVKLVGARF